MEIIGQKNLHCNTCVQKKNPKNHKPKKPKPLNKKKPQPNPKTNSKTVNAYFIKL